MTKIIGLTGGIGSGKSTVAEMFREHGIPVYIADDRAKKILDQPEVVRIVAETFGTEILENGLVNREKLAAIVFGNPEKLEKLNAIIHPAVRRDFAQWVDDHSDYSVVIKEAAILFESGSYADCDAIITVTAPIELRIERVIKRDNVTRESVLKRIGSQWDDSEKVALSDYVIDNIEVDDTKEQVKEILKKLQKI